MPAPLLSRRDLEFYLYEMFDVESLQDRERYQDHNRESFDAALDISEKIAEDYFLPIRKTVDLNQPDWEMDRLFLNQINLAPFCLPSMVHECVQLGNLLIQAPIF